MKKLKKKECRHCRCLFVPDPRNIKKQDYCRKEPCRKASKSASQKRWLSKPDNKDHFNLLMEDKSALIKKIVDKFIILIYHFVQMSTFDFLTKLSD